MELCPWMSDVEEENWEEHVVLPQLADRISLMGASAPPPPPGIVNGIVFDSRGHFIRRALDIHNCKSLVSQKVFEGVCEPVAVRVDWNCVPDGLIDLYPDNVRLQYQECLQNTALESGARQSNLDQIRIHVDATRNERFSGVPVVAAADVMPSGCGSSGKVQKDGEFYFKKSLTIAAQFHDFIGRHCSKICFQDNCLRVHAVCNDPQVV
jgi:hypothetical protein